MADIEGIKVLNVSTQKRAKKLSEKYNVPLINSESAETYVSIDDQSILHSGNYKLENSFREGKFRARISQYQGESLLKKAIGWQSTTQKHILDTTGGLGHDAFILALLGQKITVLEKNTGLCILIEEALNNLPNLSYFNDAKNNISVINNELILGYTLVKRDVDMLIKILEQYQKEFRLIVKFNYQKVLHINKIIGKIDKIIKIKFEKKSEYFLTSRW